MNSVVRPLAVVTGASTGIGLELARLCAENKFDLVIAADEPRIHDAAAELRRRGIECTPVECDLATREGVEELIAAIERSGAEVEALLANAGRGLGGAFLDQDLDAALRVAHTNIDGTLRLIHVVGNDMRARGRGRILISGSIAGLMPGSYQAVYNGSKAFLDSFAVALNAELKDSGITVTCLIPGATEYQRWHEDPGISMGSVESNTLDSVRYEQAIVQEHLDELRQRSPRRYRREVRAANHALATSQWGGLRWFTDRCFRYAAAGVLRCLGGPLDFAEQRCRVMRGAQIARYATAAPVPLLERV